MFTFWFDCQVSKPLSPRQALFLERLLARRLPTIMPSLDLDAIRPRFAPWVSASKRWTDHHQPKA